MLNITHLMSCEIPKSGFERLYFFTNIGGKIYFGTDNNSIGSVDIERWVKNGSVVLLKNPIQIEDEENLFIGIDDGPSIYSGSTALNMKLRGKISELIM